MTIIEGVRNTKSIEQSRRKPFKDRLRRRKRRRRKKKLLAALK